MPVGGAGMHDEPRRLVHHQQRLVFVDDGERQVFRLVGAFPGVQEREEGDLLAAVHLLPRPHRPSIDGDALATSYNADTAVASQSGVSAPASGSSVARIAGPEGVEGMGGNGCVSGGPTASDRSTWGKIKVLYR